MREAGSWRLGRRAGRTVSQAFRGRDAATVTAMCRAARAMPGGCCPRAAAVLEEAEPDAPAHLDLPPSHRKRLRADNVQERASREMKRRPRVAQVFPPAASPARSCASRTRHGRGSRYFSGARMNELYDEGRGRGTDGEADWARLEAEAEARKMLESGLELADRVEAA